MGDRGAAATVQPEELLALYDTAVADVYRYLRRRCGSAALAEDLTSETFFAAADALHRETIRQPDVRWLMAVARNKLVDHWRRSEREARRLEAVYSDGEDDPWDAQIDSVVAHEVLSRLGPAHRSVLTLRYLDDLPVAEIATCMERTVGATEVLLVRARRAFRAEYESGPPSGEESS